MGKPNDFSSTRRQAMRIERVWDRERTALEEVTCKEHDRRYQKEAEEEAELGRRPQHASMIFESLVNKRDASTR